MEGLTKQQLILIALLVSFVTSIATGIVTVALMDQAPPGVTQTINRVVERTIEKVVQAPASSQTVSAITKETVVVKEDDVIMGAIEKTSSSLVRITRPSTGTGLSEVVSLGLIVTRDGVIIADRSIYVPGTAYSAIVSGGKTYSLSEVYEDLNWNFVFFKVKPSQNEKVSFTPVALGNSDRLKLGQTVIYLGGEKRDEVETGIISSLIEDSNANESEATTTDPNLSPSFIAIITNLKANSAISGEVLLNLSGETVGGRYWRGDHYSYLASNVIVGSVASYFRSTEEANASLKGLNQ